MKKKTQKRQKKPLSSNKRSIVILCIIFLIVVIVSIFAWMKGGEAVVDKETRFLSGKITKKQTSCSEERLLSDGTVKRGGGVCDSGNSLTVSGVTVATGGGALEVHKEYPYYITDIDAVHAGDAVEVRYKLDDTNRATTNCRSCYVKKSGALSPEPQQTINKPVKSGL